MRTEWRASERDVSKRVEGEVEMAACSLWSALPYNEAPSHSYLFSYLTAAKSWLVIVARVTRKIDPIEGIHSASFATSDISTTTNS